MSNNTLTMEQEQRRKWVDEYNNSLPQKKWFDTEFDEEMTIAIGGIYDGEAELYEFDNRPSTRIKNVLQIQYELGELELGETWKHLITEETLLMVKEEKNRLNNLLMLVSGIKCRKCNVYLEPHTQDEHLDINHKVHKCRGGHKR